ncbi:MAG TPA: peptide chain release factor 1 [candidate division WOR-3 bacterium]|uniref:Peptide chain release factor 1 n=1 Tax=candidate division WOR-3 bacterium TaxID=2052148 RepID=A0A7V0XFT2_UNCW3|nr:peptide chain release factor 1 [candidate division WOR-3 bacterium]
MPTPSAEFERRIAPVVGRIGEVEAALSHPDVSRDPARLRDLTHELRRISALRARLKEYCRVERELAEAETMAEDAGDADLRELAEAETAELAGRLARLDEEFRRELAPRSPDWDKGCILELRPAAGGEESALFAGTLYRMYARYAELHGLKIEVLSSRPSELDGYKEMVFAVTGEEPFRRFRFESGVHRVQRVPETEAAGRIHTSTVTVAVLIEPEEVELKIDPKDLRVDVFRAGGHGGQHVNVTDSAVRITHLPTGLVVSCQDERSQGRNKTKAMKVLAARLLDARRAADQAKAVEARRGQIGTGERSEKIRTYNFPQNRVTDHRIKFTTHSLDKVLAGELDPVFDALETAEAELARGE